MSKTKGVCTECADGVTQTIAAGGLCYRHYRRKERLLNGNPDAEYDREQAWQVRLDKKEIKNVTAILRLLKDSTDFLTAAEVNIINGVLHPHLQKITNSTTPTSVIGSSAACSPDSDVHRSPDEDEQGEQEDEVNSSLPACEHKEEIEQELPIGEQSEQENKVNSSPLSAPDTPIADAPVNCEPEKDVHSSLTPSQVLRHENHVANNFKTAGCPSCFPKEKPEPPAAQNATEAQGRILAVLQPSAPYCGYIHYPEFSKYDLLKAAKFHPREEKDRAALVLDQLVSGGAITRILDDTDDSISYVLTHTPPPDEDDEDEGEPEAPAEPEPPAENVAEEPAPADPAPKPPAPEPAEEPTQESCNPRKALPGETCSCVLERDAQYEPVVICGNPAVVTCDCGSWCTNGLCFTVCEEAFEWYLALHEDHIARNIRVAGCSDCSDKPLEPKQERKDGTEVKETERGELPTAKVVIERFTQNGRCYSFGVTVTDQTSGKKIRHWTLGDRNRCDEYMANALKTEIPDYLQKSGYSRQFSQDIVTTDRIPGVVVTAPEPPESQLTAPAPEPTEDGDEEALEPPAGDAPKRAKRSKNDWYLHPQTPMEHVRRSFWNRHEGIDGVDWKRAKRILRALRRSGFTNQELVDYLRGELTYQQVFSITKVLHDCGVTTVFCKPGTVAPTRNQIWVLKGEPGDPEYKAPVKAKAVA